MIRLSTTCRYAARILVYLASRESAHPASRSEIADAEGISPAYIEQVLRSLKAAGLVKSRRGAKGGFLLGKSPETITVADIVEATEGALSLAPCLAEDCERASSCVVRSVWKRAGEALRRELARTAIEDMAKQLKYSRRSGTVTFEI